MLSIYCAVAIWLHARPTKCLQPPIVIPAIATSTQQYGSLAFPPSTVEGTSTAGWTQNGSNVYLNNSSNFVGIGTNAPSQKLTVTGGNFDLTGNITQITGTINWVGGAVSLGGTTLNLGSGAATSTITSKAGNLGIGTTTPSKTFSVQGNTYTTGLSTSATLEVASSTTKINGISYVWPATAGAANTNLQTDGSNNLSWVGTASAFFSSTVIPGETLPARTPVYMNTGTSTLLTIASSTPASIVTIGAAARSKQAQQFIMGSPIAMTRIIVNGDNAGGATLAMSISIQSDSGGNPSGTVLASTSVAANLWATTDEYHTIPLSYTFAAASTTYWMVFEPIAPNGVDQFDLGQAAGNLYPDGAQKVWNGSSWANQAIDMGITFYGSQGVELGYLANGKATSTSLTIGFNQSLVGTSTAATIITTGVVSGFTNLVVGSNYYLSPTASGTIQTSGNHLIGRAIASTTLLVIPPVQ